MADLPVSVVIISANSAETIRRCLGSLTDFDEVIVYLNRCTDNTAELCAGFENVRVVQGEFIGFGPTRDAAAEHARHPWILAIDTDEWLDDELKRSIRNAKLDSPDRAYVIRRYQRFLGESVTRPGMRAKRIVRLYHRETGKYGSKILHEAVELAEGVKPALLPGKLWHEKESRDRAAYGLDSPEYGIAYDERFPEKKAIHPGLALLRSWATFFKKYFLERKFLAGWRGIVLAQGAAHHVFIKHTTHFVNTKIARDRQSAD